MGLLFDETKVRLYAPDYLASKGIVVPVVVLGVMRVISMTS